jgi:multifunctional beta-oxidation protein
VNQQVLDAIESAKKAEAKGTEFKYEERDVILYNLGIGAKRTDLPYVL